MRRPAYPLREVGRQPVLSEKICRPLGAPENHQGPSKGWEACRLAVTSEEQPWKEDCVSGTGTLFVGSLVLS